MKAVFFSSHPAYNTNTPNDFTTRFVKQFAQERFLCCFVKLPKRRWFSMFCNKRQLFYCKSRTEDLLINAFFFLLSISLVCAIAVDLAFLIDGSSSIERYGRGNFGRLLNFVKSLVSFFPISRRETHIGVILYTTRAFPIFNFNRYYTRAAILRAIDNMRYPKGGTRIGKALSFARRYLFR